MTPPPRKSFKGFFRKRYGKTKNPLIPVINVKDDNRKDQYYKEHFTDLLVLIYTNLSKNVNYNHISFVIPRNPDLPIYLNGDEFDISYLTPDKCLIMIKFKCINPSRLKTKYKRLYG